MAYISVDVDIDDIIWDMSSKDKQQLVDDLYEDGYTPTALDKRKKSTNFDFDDACEALVGNSWRLTKEEEEYIIKIAKRFQ